MERKIDIDRYKQMYLDFLKSRHTTVLSFVDSEGKPFSSTVPFVKKDGKFYIYISRVAEHYYLTENSEVVDMLVLADEADTKNAFATERVRFACTPRNLGNEAYEEIFELFEQAFRKSTMSLLRGLDFSLFELTPIVGRYVVGFGLAFDITIDGTIFKHVVINKDQETISK